MTGLPERGRIQGEAVILCVATTEEMTPFLHEGWRRIPTDDLYPHEIRRVLDKILAEDRAADSETRWFTVNRTILDHVGDVTHKWAPPIDFENVFLIDEEGKMIPLLEFHEPSWLCHFSFGDVVERCQVPSKRAKP